MVKDVDMKNHWALKNKGDPTASHQTLDLEKRYALLRVEIVMNVEWLQKITKGINNVVIMKEWLAEGKYLRLISSKVYFTTNFKKPYQIVITIICRLYGAKNAIFFKERCLPLVHDITTKGIVFKVTMLSLNIIQAIKRVIKLVINTLMDSLCPLTC
jgi:hypothetical protein